MFFYSLSHQKVFSDARVYTMWQIVKYAKNRDFTAIIVIHDNRKEPSKFRSKTIAGYLSSNYITTCWLFLADGMLVINLPEGPTAHFKISNVVLSKKIKVGFFSLLKLIQHVS